MLAIDNRCPRCGAAGLDEGYGLSRLDNSTRICTPCEIDESIEDYVGEITPMNVWPVERAYNEGK